MQFIKSILKLASTPPWAKHHTIGDTEGYWVDTNMGHPMFLRHDGIIWLPKSLRGRKIEDLSLEEVKAVPKEDSGKTHYQNWQSQFNNGQEVNKLYNGYSFSQEGQLLIERLKKLADKYELEDVSAFGLDSKYSVNPLLFDKLLQTTNSDDVKRIGRLIAKKFATVIHMLAQVDPKVAKRLDADFMLQYKKLKVLFDFDVMDFQPNIPEPQEPIQVFEILQYMTKTLIQELKPLIKDPQMVQVADVLKNISEIAKDKNARESIDLFRKVLQAQYKELIEKLDELTVVGANHPAGQAAEQALSLPIMEEFYSILF